MGRLDSGQVVSLILLIPGLWMLYGLFEYTLLEFVNLYCNKGVGFRVEDFNNCYIDLHGRSNDVLVVPIGTFDWLAVQVLEQD